MFKRRQFLTLISAAGGAALLPLSLGAGGAGASTTERRTLIRGAALISMDPAIGDLDSGDVLIEGRKITALAPNIEADDAEIIDARGMILMPGMIDGHRHLWASMRLARAKLNLMNLHLALGPCMRPEDLYNFTYLGGKATIDSGVTRVVDHSHITTTPEKGEASVRGAIDSGVGGFCCYRIGGNTNYGPGDSVDSNVAWENVFARPDEWHLSEAVRLRDRYFSSSDAPLQFGVALTSSEFATRTQQQVHDEFITARQLGAKLLTQHVLGASGAWRMGLSDSYRLIPDLNKAGLLGENYIISHGNNLTTDELKMLRDNGSSVASTVLSEVHYSNPSIHGRAHAIGLPAAIGIDSMLANPIDYFDHVRTAESSLWRGNEETRQIAQSLTPRDYLNFATLGGAKAIGMESQVGSLTPGKLADVVMLRTDRRHFPKIEDLAERVMLHASIHDIDSVWIGGKREKKDGELLGLDPGAYQKATESWDYVLQQGDTITLTGSLPQDSR